LGIIAPNVQQVKSPTPSYLFKFWKIILMFRLLILLCLLSLFQTVLAQPPVLELTERMEEISLHPYLHIPDTGSVGGSSLKPSTVQYIRATGIFCSITIIPAMVMYPLTYKPIDVRIILSQRKKAQSPPDGLKSEVKNSTRTQQEDSPNDSTTLF
jgi:hypothetical protein